MLGSKETKKFEKPQAYISLHFPDKPPYLIMTKISKGGSIYKVIEPAKIDVDRLIVGGCAGS
jgi:hypothetical protein